MLFTASTLASLLLLSPGSSLAAEPGQTFPRGEAFSVEGLSQLESAVPNLKEFVGASALSYKDSIDTSAPPKAYYIEAPDKSIYGKWLDWGAFVHEFWMKDKTGTYRDLVLGFDDLTEYQTNRQYFGPIVGRYANRVPNGTYSIPITRYTKNNTKVDAAGQPVKVYNIPNNEHNGEDSLHGGTIGFDLRRWSLARSSSNSLTFSLLDPNGTMGFPGDLYTYVTYTLNEGAQYEIAIWAQTTEDTPVLLSSHTFWNFDGYYPFDKSNPNATNSLFNNKMKIQSDKIVAFDGNEVPTGPLTDVTGTPYDFRKATEIGKRINKTINGCGTGCTGYDNCWIYEDGAPANGDIVWSNYSPNSGIKLEVKTNQLAAQVYTCDNTNLPSSAPVPRKKSQLYGHEGYYGQYSCFVLEQEAWIDGINNPEWHQDQILKPGDTYNWWASYQFSVE